MSFPLEIGSISAGGSISPFLIIPLKTAIPGQYAGVPLLDRKSRYKLIEIFGEPISFFSTWFRGSFKDTKTNRLSRSASSDT